MSPLDIRPPNEALAPKVEPLWIAVALWPFRVPIVTGLAATVLFVLAMFCAMIAGPLQSPVAWGCSVLFGLLAATAAAALVLRRLRSSEVAAWGMQHYRQTLTGSTAFIIALFCAIYGWFLTILIHSNVFAANRVGGTKYWATVAIAGGASLYLTIYGRRRLFQTLAKPETSRMTLTAGQALLTIGLCVAAGVYFAWLMV
ncbi:MAG TPA: hypothetical protein VFB80_06660 [Pirellulaceae bacterium]|nr:hypothetical protein [Pirellulaceae bacterium]